VRQVVQAHPYWRMKGLAVDLVIWNEDDSVYRQTPGLPRLSFVRYNFFLGTTI
jgi:cellobiose phosphorylase